MLSAVLYRTFPLIVAVPGRKLNLAISYSGPCSKSPASRWNEPLEYLASVRQPVSAASAAEPARSRRGDIGPAAHILGPRCPGVLRGVRWRLL